MLSIYLIFGYGIPKDILKDENYNFYLKMVFNKIYDLEVKNKSADALIIPCGGKTDMRKPYKRTEADEMIKFFSKLIKSRPFIKDMTKKWRFVPERQSISTLENFVNAKKIIDKLKIKNTNCVIFCEQTRGRRIKILVKKIFGKNFKITVAPVDFDVTTNRYLDPEFLDRKEKIVLKYDLLALKNPANFKKYHSLFQEKIAYLRKAGPNAHTDALKKWWEKKLEQLK
ncbi:MAG: hypothetical protein WC766_02720 [Patescibacteria group bacterium]|jgi:hypothetical protein